jgi:hypothetical protein
VVQALRIGGYGFDSRSKPKIVEVLKKHIYAPLKRAKKLETGLVLMNNDISVN